MGKKQGIWESRPTGDDLEAARTYLEMVLEDRTVSRIVASLRQASTIMLKAKDVLRASNLPLLEKDDPHVAQDLKRIEKRKKLSPVLLLRGDAMAGIPMTIADGYHRICASYHWDESCPVACRLVAPLRR